MKLWRSFSLGLVGTGWMGLAVFNGCSSAEAPLDAGLVADAAVESGPTTSDASASDGGSCDDCGSPRFMAECVTAEMACLNDAGCSAIRSCIFSGGAASLPCALDATGPACVDSCIERNCIGAPSVTLYRTLDQCAYCTACTASCSQYCSASTDAGVAVCSR